MAKVQMPEKSGSSLDGNLSNQKKARLRNLGKLL